MTRTGYSKQQQNQLKQLVFECSIARLPTAEIQQIALDKLGIQVTENWIGRIKRGLRKESEAEFKKLVSDNFAYKYQYMQRIKEFEEIQRMQWEIAKKKEPLTNADLIRLKCLSELKESIISMSNLYEVLPAIDNFRPTFTATKITSPFRSSSSYEDEDETSRDTLSSIKRDIARDYNTTPDHYGRYPGDPGYDKQAKF